MNLIRYYPKIIKFGIEYTSPGVDILIKRIRYENNSSADIILGKLLFYPQSPGSISLCCNPEYYIPNDGENKGIKYFVVNQTYYFPLCTLFKYIQNKNNAMSIL